MIIPKEIPEVSKQLQINKDMDLKEFIKETISQISEAIIDLNQQKESILIVNPASTNGPDMIDKGYNTYKQTALHYNIALTILDEGSAGGKIGVLGGWFSGSAEAGSKNQSQALTSLDFRLDVLFPQG